MFGSDAVSDGCLICQCDASDAPQPFCFEPRTQSLLQCFLAESTNLSAAPVKTGDLAQAHAYAQPTSFLHRDTHSSATASAATCPPFDCQNRVHYRARPQSKGCLPLNACL